MAKYYNTKKPKETLSEPPTPSFTAALHSTDVVVWMSTIMDKSLGTVVQFERFLTHAKLYPRATSTAHPYPLPQPHRQC